MLFIKGLVIGIGKIIPGISGSLIAISLGEYEKMVNSINNFFKNIMYNSKYLFKILSGILVSIILFSNIIVKLIDKYYIYTMFLFGGFIIGSISDIKRNIKGDYYLVIVSLILFFLINELVFEKNMLFNKNFIYYVFGGFLDSFTMIIPGISGTAVLISYGCYNDVILALSSINITILIPFIIGMFLGVFITIKIVDFLFSKYKSKSYSVILGISIETIIIMLSKGIQSSSSVMAVSLSILLFILGIFISKKTTAYLAID